MYMKSKILKSKDLVQKVDNLRGSGKSIVFTNGCFDILHAGHVRYLTAANTLGDVLIVGLNSDKSVKSIKGEKRPIVCQKQRAEVLAGLGCVDYVTLFDEPDPLKLIYIIKPDVLVKGDDWSEDNIIGAEYVKAGGGKIIRIPFAYDISTTDIIRKIVANYG